MLACFASGSGLDARGGKRLKTRVDGPSTSGSFIPAATAGASAFPSRRRATFRSRKRRHFRVFPSILFTPRRR